MMVDIATWQRLGYAHRMALMDDIRKLIQNSDRTRNRIAQDAGLSASGLSRLMSGERGLSVESLEQLADALGYTIELRPKPRARKAVK
jgi:transcriptional regulator with XRE-family HTH domain